MMRKALPLLILLALAVAPIATGAVAKTVKVRDDFFKPVAVTIKKGQTVKWSWGDGTNHKHTVTAKSGKWTSANKKTGTYKHTFKNAGKFTVLCTTHPQKMVMKVTVEK
jgi:plastocyanin